MPNPLPPPRNDLVIQTHDELLRVLQEFAAAHNLRPDEGMIAVELLFGTVFTNGITNAPAESKEAVRAFHMRAVVRMSSHVSAWPAKVHERQ